MAGSRNFVLLDGVADYLSLASARTFAGDFKAGGWFQLSATGSNDTILGRSGSAADFIKANSDTTITASFNSTALVFTVPSLGTSGHSAFITTTSGTPVLNLDGTLYPEDTTTTYAGSVTFDVFGQSNGAAFFGGYLWDVELEDISTPSVQTYAINQATANTELPLQNVVGADLWTNPPSTLDAGWTDNSDDTYTHTGGAGELRITGNPLTEGNAYQCAITVSGAGSVTFKLGGPGSNNTSALLSVGSHYFALTAEGTGTLNAIRIISSSEVTVALVSVMQVTNALTYNSLPTASREYYLFSCATGIWDSTTTAKQITGGPVGCATVRNTIGLSSLKIGI